MTGVNKKGKYWHPGDPTFAPVTIAPVMISPATKVRVRAMIGFLIQGRITIRIRIRVGVIFNRRSNCRTFWHPMSNIQIESSRAKNSRRAR